MSAGERVSKAANAVHQATEDAIVTASYGYVSSWPIMRAYANATQSLVQNRDASAFIGWQGTDDDGGGQGSITFVVRKDEYWQVYINGNYSNFVCWYTPLSGGTSQVPAHGHPELSDDDHEHDPNQNVDCTAVGEDCRTAISELDESTALNSNDEFIISTKDSSEVYSSKKVKLSLIESSIKPTPTTTSPGGGGGGKIVYVDPHVLLDVGPSLAQADTGTITAVNAWPGGQKGFWQTFSIPTSIVPATAKAILIRGETVSQDDNGTQCNTKIYMKSSSFTQRVLSQAYSPNNSDDAASDVNSTLIPYSSSIDLVYYGKGIATHNMAKVYIDGYLEEGSGSGGGEGGSVEVYRSEETDMPTTNTTFSFTHNLSQAPDYITHSLVCQNDEHGYVAGDEIHFAGSYSSSLGWITFTADDSEIKMSVYYANAANGPWYVDRRGGSNAANYITRANWKVIVRGYSYSGVGGGSWNFTDQTVDAALAPTTTWQSLDLSSFVGSNSAYVVFEAYGNTNGYSLNLDLRKPGSSIDPNTGIDRKIDGIGIGHQLNGVTDSSGVIEYRQSNVIGTGTITLKIIAYSVDGGGTGGGGTNGAAAGTVIGHFFIYTNAEGTSAKDFPWTIDLKNKTKQGYSTWSGANFKLTDMILGEHYELRDQTTPTEWTNNTTDFSGCKVLASAHASLSDANWLGSGKFVKLNSNYQDVGLHNQTGPNVWQGRHITANSENKIEFDFGSNETNAKIVYGIIVK